MSKFIQNPVDESLKTSVAAKRDQLIALTQQLVRTISVNPPGKEEKVAALLIPKLEELGFELQIVEVDKGRPNILATFKGSKPGLRLLCYAHMDTVPEWDVGLWSHEPFGAEIVDGKMYGRGTCDHKSEIACFIIAFEALQELKVELTGELLFIFDSDEEQGGIEGMQELMKMGLVKADLGLYGCTTQISAESRVNFPTMGDVNIVHATTGIISYKFTVPGTQSYPRYLMNLENSFTPGDHALFLLTELKQLMDKVNAVYDPKTGHAKLWVQTVNTVSKVESARPGTMGVCEVVVSRRVATIEDIDEAEHELLAAVARVEASHGFRIQKELIRKRRPTLVPENAAIIEYVKQAAWSVDGSEPKVTGIPALTGMGWFVNEGGIPMVLFGYGNLDFHHCVDEYIELDNLVKSAQAYAIAIKNILL
ncbi:MAG: M20 family metallopeptidase [Desulfitobacteriaceae bacterium]